MRWPASGAPSSGRFGFIVNSKGFLLKLKAKSLTGFIGLNPQGGGCASPRAACQGDGGGERGGGGEGTGAGGEKRGGGGGARGGVSLLQFNGPY
jgi:hypothetical protein